MSRPIGRDAGEGGDRPPSRRSVRPWVVAALAGLLALALINAYGQAMTMFVRDLWGPEFSFYDNGRTVSVKLHRLPPAATPPQVGPDGTWPEQALRPACFFSLNLLGLSGPEGGLWTASLEGEGRGRVLTVRSTGTQAVVGRYRVTEGSEETGLAVVELEAGPRGLYLMDVLEPRPGAGWYVVSVYRVPAPSEPG